MAETEIPERESVQEETCLAKLIAHKATQTPRIRVQRLQRERGAQSIHAQDDGAQVPTYCVGAKTIEEKHRHQQSQRSAELSVPDMRQSYKKKKKHTQAASRVHPCDPPQVNPSKFA